MADDKSGASPNTGRYPDSRPPPLPSHQPPLVRDKGIDVCKADTALVSLSVDLGR